MGCKWSSLYALGIETHIQFLSCVNPTLPLEISNSQCRRVNFLGSTAVSGVLVNWRVQECRPEPHGGGQGLLFGLVPLPLLFLLPGFGLFIAIPTKNRCRWCVSYRGIILLKSEVQLWGNPISTYARVTQHTQTCAPCKITLPVHKYLIEGR